ncbi:hypothetical protein G5714_014657 [Onychostoma macrolepis]|uniref:Uncharacterized protein n=1 Tax=Onychostoma macrolepis TaxID=369639 RepID=A0A7J6CE08_9TELE|nr:hypothetical protein G5714_014657 [Onychostoma macrolepis]
MFNGVLTALERVSPTGRWRRSSVIGPDQEGLSCLEWGSSRSRRTGPAGRQPWLIRGQRVKRVRDVRQGELSQHPMGDRDSGHRTGKPRQAGGKDVRLG